MKSKKIICVLLSLCVIIGCIVPALAQDSSATTAHEWDHGVKTTCNGNCGQSPIIVVPGIMQSQVYVQDENGKDLMTSDGFPIVEGMDMAFMIDTEALKVRLKESIGDMLLSILKHDRKGLLDILVDILDESFRSHYFNADGTRKNDVAVDEYWYSLAECKNRPEKSYNYAKGYSKDDDGNVLPTTKYKCEYDFIERQVDIRSFCEKYGYDHTYYFSYASFGNIIESAEKLNEYIQMVKEQTGHSKVSIVFISLGGTIGNVYLSEFCNPADIDRIVFAASAIDGSYLLGDLMDGASTLDNNEVIYNDLIPNIVALAADEYMALAYLGNAVAKAIPSELFNEFLDEALTRAVNEVLGNLLRNCQSMWALVPSDMYPDLSKKYISDDDHAELKAMTDRYYEIQKNAGETLKRLTSEGMTIFVISGYNLELPALVEHYKVSADNIIQAASTSVGATFADVGSTLPDDYTPAINESYINPERTVDAGSCALPDRTWFVKNQSHLELQSSVNDVIEMCVQLITDKRITDARVNNGGYPQFNEYRDLSEIENLMRKCNSYDMSTLSDFNRESVEEAYARCEKVLASRTWSAEEANTAEQVLYRAMYSAKMLSKDADSPMKVYTIAPLLVKICKWFSELCSKIFGKGDIWLIPVNLI